ncbi:MAG: hypothetical protein DBY42_05850 [Bacillota bacterium]|nr:MAG: hypothetical protein DBY42_05850 [Bacillota bacterium]
MKVHFKKIRLEKRHWVFLGLVAALCLTGIINMRLNSITGETQPIALKPSETPTQEQQSEEGAATSASANFFTNYRAERTATRDKEMTYLNEIIGSEKTDAETLKDAQEQKMALTTAMEKELLVEGLIKAKGFTDCIVTVQNNSVNVVVDNTEALTSAQASQIMEIVRRETGVAAEDIKILPKN